MKKIASLLPLILLLPQVTFAHGIGQVYALPVPLKYYMLGAALAVACSFFVLAIFLKKEKHSDEADTNLPVPWLKIIIAFGKGMAFLLLILTVTTGIFGSQNPTRNFAPVFFWIYFLLGMGILSLLFGNIWDKVNPWKALSNWAGESKSVKEISGFVGILLFVGLFWFELVSGASFSPRTIGIVLVIYTLTNLIGGMVYRNWYRDAELFSVLFGFIGKIAHFRIGLDNKSIVIVNENQKLRGIPGQWWTLGIASVLLAGASFDSLKETAMWFRWVEALGFSATTKFPETAGLILAPLPFLLLYLLALWMMKLLVGKEYRTMEVAKMFIWSLIPIAFGYTLAHNFSLTIVTAPRILALVSDPFGFGWNLFGTAQYIQKDLLLGAKIVWFIEIGFVVVAHIFGVWYAHVLATNIFKDPKVALRSQFPIMILMIGFTIMTLWLLSAPLVVAK